MTKRVVLVRHGDDPPDDRVYTFLVTHGFEPVVRRPYLGEALGEPDGSLAGSVVYGGGFNVFETERYPFLKDEHRWIEQCMARGLPLLGICQGAQSIAHILGARVGPPPDERHEFGYYPIYPAEAGRAFLPAPLVVTQAHFHGFEVPPGADLLAYSEAFPHQAFCVGASTYGVQFHPEVTIEGFRRWQAAPWAAYGKLGAQTRAEQTALMHTHDAQQAEWFYGFLTGLFGAGPTPEAP